jgi:catechol 2,3-dioxygenase-like lactoylglutathione lyase family enzyme
MDASASRPDVAIGHIVMYASEVPASARFYETLGCRPVHASRDMAILELRGGTHLMLFAGEPTDREQPGFDLMVDELSAYRDRLIAAGIQCTELERHERSGHELFKCDDPDGYRVVVYSNHSECRSV